MKKYLILAATMLFATPALAITPPDATTDLRSATDLVNKTLEDAQEYVSEVENSDNAGVTITVEGFGDYDAAYLSAVIEVFEGGDYISDIYEYDAIDAELARDEYADLVDLVTLAYDAVSDGVGSVAFRDYLDAKSDYIDTWGNTNLLTQFGNNQVTLEFVFQSRYNKINEILASYSALQFNTAAMDALYTVE